MPRTLRDQIADRAAFQVKKGGRLVPLFEMPGGSVLPFPTDFGLGAIRSIETRAQNPESDLVRICVTAFMFRMPREEAVDTPLRRSDDYEPVKVFRVTVRDEHAGKEITSVWSDLRDLVAWASGEPSAMYRRPCLWPERWKTDVISACTRFFEASR